MSVEDAIHDKNLRQEVINQAREYKYRMQKRDLINKLKAEIGGVKYRGSRHEIFQRMADQYIVWWIETYKDAPDFQERYEALMADKAHREEIQREKIEQRKERLELQEKPSDEEMLERVIETMEKDPNADKETLNRLKERLKTMQ